MSPVAASRLPRGAETCRLVRKTETSLDPDAATHLGREVRLEKRKLRCAASSGQNDVRSVSAIFVWTYKTGFGQHVPADFDTQANGILSTLVISR